MTSEVQRAVFRGQALREVQCSCGCESGGAEMEGGPGTPLKVRALPFMSAWGHHSE